MSRAALRILAIRTKHDGQEGFALLEILVGFVILAIGLSVISTGIAIAMRSDTRTQSIQVALRLAQSRLEAAGVSETLLPGYREGQTEKFLWKETISAVPIGPKPRGAQVEKQGEPTPIAPYWVEIAVQGADGITVRLAALKLSSEVKQ
jgi:general secretion pathway protein I